MGDYYKDNLDIKDNSYINTCPGYCNEKLQCPTTLHNGKTRRLCWSENLCQIVKNPRQSGEECGNGGNCYTTNKGINETVSCHKECLGGCFQDKETGRQDRDQCFSCQNVYWKTADSNAHDCMRECPPGHFKYEKWRCITRDQCEDFYYTFNADTIASE